MKVMKPPFSSIESVLTRRSVGHVRQRAPHAAARTSKAVDTASPSTRQAFQVAQAERARRVQILKDQIKSGSYRPNLEIVAERLMADLGVGLG